MTAASWGRRMVCQGTPGIAKAPKGLLRIGRGDYAVDAKKEQTNYLRKMASFLFIMPTDCDPLAFFKHP
jgi:hypothetical protein